MLWRMRARYRQLMSMSAGTRALAGQSENRPRWGFARPHSRAREKLVHCAQQRAMSSRTEQPSVARPKRLPHTVPRTTQEHASSRLNDITMRLALRAKLLEKQADEPDTVLLEELGLCRGCVRVDIAVVNGSLCGYEIKSDADNLHRLATQVDVYSKVLDRATLVVGQRLLTGALDAVPSWWGVLTAVKTNTGLRFRTVRRGRRNPSTLRQYWGCCS